MSQDRRTLKSHDFGQWLSATKYRVGQASRVGNEEEMEVSHGGRWPARPFSLQEVRPGILIGSPYIDQSATGT